MNGLTGWRTSAGSTKFSIGARWTAFEVGIRFLGKRNLRGDRSGQSEEDHATRWVVVLWIPVFPIATCTVRRTLSRWVGLPFKSDPQIIERQARDWEQILLTWVKTAAVLF